MRKIEVLLAAIVAAGGGAMVGSLFDSPPSHAIALTGAFLGGALLILIIVKHKLSCLR